MKMELAPQGLDENSKNEDCEIVEMKLLAAAEEAPEVSVADSQNVQTPSSDNGICGISHQNFVQNVVQLDSTGVLVSEKPDSSAEPETEILRTAEQQVTNASEATRKKTEEIPDAIVTIVETTDGQTSDACASIVEIPVKPIQTPESVVVDANSIHHEIDSTVSNVEPESASAIIVEEEMNSCDMEDQRDGCEASSEPIDSTNEVLKNPSSYLGKSITAVPSTNVTLPVQAKCFSRLPMNRRQCLKRQSWSEKLKAKQQLVGIKQKERALRDANFEKLQKQRLKTEEKKKRKLEAEIRVGKVQVMRDGNKIKKLSNKAKKNLIKMSAEKIHEYYGIKI